nr:phage/plasmid replication protein [uncultured Marinifilum sp.]
MYDTVNMWLGWEQVGNFNLSTITRKLDNQTEHQKEDYTYISGSLRNYRVGLSETGISLKGSLPKYVHGYNLHTLTRSGAERAIQQLSDDLSLPIKKARITQVDLSTHFLMNRPAKDYYSYLGSKPYFKRLQATDETLYYNAKARQLIFYNKLKEATSKGADIPDVFLNENTLRYEIRHKGSLPKQFKLPEVTASTLCEESFYMNLIDIWVNEYKGIQKRNRLSVGNMNDIKTVKDAENMLFGVLLNKVGLDEIENLVSDMKSKKVYSDPKYYSRLKSKLIQLANKPEITERSELITELDNEIGNIKQYYR